MEKIQLATATKRTPQQIYNTLSEMRKIDIRRASPDRLRYLTLNDFQIECDKDIAVMEEVQRMCNDDIKRYDAMTDIPHGYIPSLWKF